MKGCQLFSTLTGGKDERFKHFGIFHQIDLRSILGLGPKIPEHHEGTTEYPYEESR